MPRFLHLSEEDRLAAQLVWIMDQIEAASNRVYDAEHYDGTYAELEAAIQDLAKAYDMLPNEG